MRGRAPAPAKAKEGYFLYLPIDAKVTPNDSLDTGIPEELLVLVDHSSIPPYFHVATCVALPRSRGIQNIAYVENHW
jgi:hypothetical protein